MDPAADVAFATDKPDKYWFEIWMMFEKMVLIGLMGLWSPSITQKAANVLISTISIVMIAWHIPSKTHECKSPRLPRLRAVSPTCPMLTRL